MEISNRGLLAIALLPLLSGVALAAPPPVDPSTLPKVECSTLRYSKEYLDQYPKAPSACQEARVYKGKTYMKVKGKIYIADEAKPTVAVEDSYGNALGTVAVKNPKSVRVIVDGEVVPFSSLKARQELTFWVPESTFAAHAMPAK
ncbi:MAG TPA: hypothetical protein VLW26_12435 [Steroidobacteraceae bacterium]|nr:hypothetical protein [Steroidobacteraceae bacterium]